ANRCTSSFQILADAAIVVRAARGIIVVKVEWRQELVDRADLQFILAAVACAKFQLRNGYGRQSDRIAGGLSLAAALHKCQGALPLRRLPRGLEAANHEDHHVGVDQVDHDFQARRCGFGWARPAAMKSSDSSSTPSKKISHGSRAIT